MKVRAISEHRGWILALCALVGLLLLTLLGAFWWLRSSGLPIDTLAQVRALPVYPGASSVMVKEKPSGPAHVGVLTFQANSTADDIQAFYAATLKQAGWLPAGRQSDGGGGGYFKREGSFEGIEFVGGKDASFPWLRVKTNDARLWLDVRVSETVVNTLPHADVSIELTAP